MFPALLIAAALSGPFTVDAGFRVAAMDGAPARPDHPEPQPEVAAAIAAWPGRSAAEPMPVQPVYYAHPAAYYAPAPVYRARPRAFSRGLFSRRARPYYSTGMTCVGGACGG